MGPSLANRVRDLWLHLTDVTLADEDTNSILTDNKLGQSKGQATLIASVKLQRGWMVGSTSRNQKEL